jgi:adenylate cyclase
MAGVRRPDVSRRRLRPLGLPPPRSWRGPGLTGPSRILTIGHVTRAEEMTRDRLAEMAGVDVAYIDELVRVGALVPQDGDRFRASDVRRINIVQALEGAGLPLVAIGTSIAQGHLSLDFVEDPSYDRFAATTATTFRQLSEQTNVPLDILLTIREAMGSARPEPDDRVRESELDVLPMLRFQATSGVRPAISERALRVYGDSLRRVAETEADWWGSDILAPLFRSGVSVGDVGRAIEPFLDDATETTDRALLALFHGHQSKAWMRNILESVETILDQSGVHARADRPPAIAFLDLTGYTRLTDERGDDAAATLARELGSLVQGLSARHGGRAVKWLGDGVMFHFRNPGDAVRASLEMVEAGGSAGLPPAHVGIHAGPVLFQEGDYFGRTVNLASRISDFARPSEVLVTPEVVKASDDVHGLSFDAIGPVRLKGVEREVMLLRAARTG